MNFPEAQFWDAVSDDDASPSALLALQDSGPQTGSASAGRGACAPEGVCQGLCPGTRKAGLVVGEGGA